MRTISPVLPDPNGRNALRPIGLARARFDEGFWADRLRLNRDRTIPHGAAMLDSHGNIENFALAASGGPASAYRHTQGDLGTMPFLDSDVTKWLEAVAWELARGERPELRALAEPMVEAVVRAQRADGYIDTFYQVALPGREFEELAWGHELYVAGHLVQAAVAWKRALDDDRLLGVATRFVARIEAEMGPGRREGICGHPEFEMALVELFRTTGERRYVEFARTLIERRGHGLLGGCRFGSGYWQDHEPVRSAAVPVGHAVRQMYLDCGAVDVAVETGDEALLAAVIRRWEAMRSSFMYLTGGLGAHHQDEAFGAAFELPPDRAYTETCAAIGGAMLSWRLLLATGEERFADLIERQLYNAILPSLAPDGCHFFYTNPLMQRSSRDEVKEGIATTSRTEWPVVACCPPNLMRFLAALPDLAVTASDDGLAVHQYAGGTFRAEIAGGEVAIGMRTAYPWDGDVEIEILETVDAAWTLGLRVPEWCAEASVAAPEEGRVSRERKDRIEIARRWRRGDRVRLRLPIRPRVTVPDPRIDAVRGSVAIERGPLVYCVEDAGLPPGTSVESLEVDPAGLEFEERRVDDAGFEQLVALSFDAFVRTENQAAWPYGSPGDPAPVGRSCRVSALPYFAWGNRAGLGMRVWIPAARVARGA